MDNDKLQILKMLEAGQITADEAARRLQGVSAPVAPPAPAAPPPPSHTYTPPPSASGYASNNGRPGSHSSSSSTTFDDISRKFESFAKDMAPKVQKFAESAASAIAGVADKVSDALTAPPSSGGHTHVHSGGQSARTHAPAKPVSAGGVSVINIEQLVEPGSHNELSLAGLNGDIRIKGYNGDKITARISYKTKRAGAPIEFVKLGSKFYLSYEADDFNQVSIDAYVPERAFSVIKVDGINGAVDCSSLTAGDVRVVNTNGTLAVSGLDANSIFIENANGKVSINKISAESAAIENINGLIDCTEPDVKNLKLTNFNSPVSVVISNFARHNDYMWSVETGNAKLTMNLPTMPNLGYHVKAKSAMGSIKLGLTGMQFLLNEPSLAEAKSVSFDAAVKKVKIAAETSNAALVIN